MAKIPQYLLNLAGEYRVCSELNKRGVFATITYGNRKGADVYAINDHLERALKVEVKTSQRKNFVTSLSKRKDDPAPPDFWVLVQIERAKDGAFSERFFVLTHEEICAAQKKRNDAFAKRYREKHGKEFDFSRGVDSVTVDCLAYFENDWSKIIDRLGGPEIASKSKKKRTVA